jgi:hypothetical protein
MIYLRTGGLPEDKVECERLCHLAGQYTLVNDELFQHSVNDTLMECITPDEGCVILQDIHVGGLRQSCGHKIAHREGIQAWVLLGHCHI